MPLKKCQSTPVPPFPCPVSFKTQNKIISSKINNKDGTNICQHCQHRWNIVRKLKELCKELNLLDNLADDSVPDMHNNYSKWADKFLPLITYPIYRFDKDIHESILKLDTFPTWKLPRFPSQELVASRMNKMCDCKKRNGLQDYCARSLCQGSLQCLNEPYPLCVPSGAWKKNVNPTEAKNIMNWLDSLDGGAQKNSDYVDLCTCEPDYKFKDERSVRKAKSKSRKLKDRSKDRSNDGNESDGDSRQTLQLRKIIKKKESSAKISGSKSSVAVEETKSKIKTNIKSATTINTVSDRSTTKLASERSYPLGDIKKSIKSKVTNPKCLSIQPNLEKNETACNA